MSWELNGAIGVGLFIVVVAAAVGLLRPREETTEAVRYFRYLAIGLVLLFALELGTRLVGGESVWQAFVCASNPKASLHEPQCAEGGFP